LETWAELERFDAKHGIGLAPCSWFLVASAELMVTILFGYKQWRYYYGKGGKGKEGIFVKSLGSVNHAEMTSDVALSFVAGLLVSFCGLPTVWFAVMSVYSALVLVRVWLTIERPTFAAYLSRHGEHVQSTYGDLDRFHNDNFWIPAVLRGWVFTHSVIGVLGISVFIVLILYVNQPTDPMMTWLRVAACWRGAALALIAVVAFLASDVSYRVGCKLQPPPNMPKDSSSNPPAGRQ